MVSPITPNQIVQGYNTNIIRIQGGRDTANNYPVQLNYTALLLDEENKTFYIKTRDQNGNLQPLREFSYEETTPQNIQPNSQYVTKEEFNNLLAKIDKLQKRSRDHRKSYNKQQYNK